jgi:eukaryotic-like serine/threonine-protein kinase
MDPRPNCLNPQRSAGYRWVVLLAERYRTTEILGHGGMGEVYRGCDELLGRPVAVKLLRTDLRDPFAAARFQREARAAALVRHPHVVGVYDFGHSNGEYYLVMELMEGRSVGHELAFHGPLAPDRALGIVQQVAAGLEAAHRHDIVHRDIKPDNLLIDVDGSVKIADFGIARSPVDPANVVGSETATSGPILGTSHYLAPERALGHPATPASDVYALGCVLYQLLTGHPPFQGDNPTEILSRHIEAAPDIPADLAVPTADLLRRMLAKDPGDRPTTTEIASEIDTGIATGTFVTASLPTTELVPPSPRRNKRAFLAALAGLIVAASAVTAGVLADERADRPLAPADIAPSPAPRQPAPSHPPATDPTVTITKAVTSRAPTRPSAVSPPSVHKSHAAPEPAGKGKHKPKKPGKH